MNVNDAGMALRGETEVLEETSARNYSFAPKIPHVGRVAQSI